MAVSSTVMQSMLASTFSRVPNNRTALNQFSPSFYVPKRANFRVRSMAEDQEGKTPDIEVEAPKVTQPSSPSPAPQSSKVKVKTGFADIFAFSGPGPERINGRLAMIGFVTAIGVEIANGQDLFAQVSNGGIPWFLGTSVLLSLASLVPLFQGVSAESKSDGFMTSDAEIWNGRFAMLGFIALAFTEYVKGGALV